MNRTIVVGDIHGCIVEFQELVAKLALGTGDRLILVGDLMDKGPDPVGAVRFAREIGAEAVMGNHEEKHLRWRRHEDRRAVDPGYKNPMRLGTKKAAQNAALSTADIAWMQAMPIMLQVDQWVIVHGGLMPGRSLDKQNSDRLRVRWVIDGTDQMAALDPEDPKQPEGTRPWMERWDGAESVVYGHAAHHLRTPRVDRNEHGSEMWGIDTGAVYGGHLTALVLETREIVQVQAREVYTTPPLPIPV